LAQLRLADLAAAIEATFRRGGRLRGVGRRGGDEVTGRRRRAPPLRRHLPMTHVRLCVDAAIGVGRRRRRHPATAAAARGSRRVPDSCGSAVGGRRGHGDRDGEWRPSLGVRGYDGVGGGSWLAGVAGGWRWRHCWQAPWPPPPRRRGATVASCGRVRRGGGGVADAGGRRGMAMVQLWLAAMAAATVATCRRGGRRRGAGRCDGGDNGGLWRRCPQGRRHPLSPHFVLCSAALFGGWLSRRPRDSVRYVRQVVSRSVFGRLTLEG